MSNTVKNAMRLHKEAMNFSEKAQIARIKKEKADALASFREAFRLEKEAAMLLKDEKVKLVTRAVLFRSAAVLALDCDEINESEQLINLGLSGKVPPQIADELQDLKIVIVKRRAKLRKTDLSVEQIKFFLTTVHNEAFFVCLDADETKEMHSRVKKEYFEWLLESGKTVENWSTQNLDMLKTNHPPKTVRFLNIFLKESDGLLANQNTWPVPDTLLQNLLSEINSWSTLHSMHPTHHIIPSTSLPWFGFDTNPPQTPTKFEVTPREQLTH